MIVRRKIYTRIQRNLQIPNIDKKKKKNLWKDTIWKKIHENYKCPSKKFANMYTNMDETNVYGEY